MSKTSRCSVRWCVLVSVALLSLQVAAARASEPGVEVIRDQWGVPHVFSQR